MPDEVITTGGRAIYPHLRLPLGSDCSCASLAPADPQAPRFVIGFVRQGSALLALDGAPQLLMSPAVLLLPHHQRPEFLRQQGLQMDVLYFHPRLINDAFQIEDLFAVDAAARFAGTTKNDFFLLERFLCGPWYSAISATAQARLTTLLLQTRQEAQMQRDGYWPCRTRSYLIELLFFLRLLEPDNGPVPVAELSDEPAQGRLNRALVYIQENYANEFTVADLAHACHSNRTTIHNEFRTATGMTIRAYVISLRMKVAAALLRDTTMPISEVMARSGYSNPSHFTRAFRQNFSQSPRDYRENHNWMLHRSSAQATPL